MTFSVSESRADGGAEPQRGGRAFHGLTQIEPEEPEYEGEGQDSHRALDGENRPENSDIIELAHPEPFFDISGQPEDDQGGDEDDRGDRHDPAGSKQREAARRGLSFRRSILIASGLVCHGLT